MDKSDFMYNVSPGKLIIFAVIVLACAIIFIPLLRKLIKDTTKEQ